MTRLRCLFVALRVISWEVGRAMVLLVFAVLVHCVLLCLLTVVISGMPSCESGCNLTPPVVVVVVRFQEAE